MPKRARIAWVVAAVALTLAAIVATLSGWSEGELTSSRIALVILSIIGAICAVTVLLTSKSQE